MTLLGACTTLSEEECIYADWRVIGFEDGVRGFGLDRLVGHRQACAGVGVIPDPLSYEQGRNAGLLRYCTLSSGLRVGKSGGSYSHV